MNSTMTIATYRKRCLRNSRVGIGGMRCPCCGPSPRYKKRALRQMKRSERLQWKREMARGQ